MLLKLKNSMISIFEQMNEYFDGSKKKIGTNPE